MSLQQIRSRLDPPLRRLGARAAVWAWDGLAALQSTHWLESSFVFWTSPADASRRTSASRLNPYLCRLQRRTLIEPRQGFVIADYGVLIETSVSNAYVVRDPYLREFMSLPSPAKYIKARILRRYRTDLESVVALATAFPLNYFHFYRDFLPKILMLEEANIDPALPVVIPDGLFDQPFFQEAIQSKRLSRWNFISSRGQFIMSESVVFCSAKGWIAMKRSDVPEAVILDEAAAGIKHLEAPAEVLALLELDDGRPQTSAERRIFLNRAGARGRTLSNYDEIEPLLSERGFETIDTDGMSLREQAQLFRECRHLIGIHGAGLVNIIYAHDHDLSLLELRQPGEEHLSTDFGLMCHAYGFDHQEMFGTADLEDRWGTFHIDVVELRLAIDRMFRPPSDQ
jgi:Glycosyltransferase 61